MWSVGVRVVVDFPFQHVRPISCFRIDRAHPFARAVPTLLLQLQLAVANSLKGVQFTELCSLRFLAQAVRFPVYAPWFVLGASGDRSLGASDELDAWAWGRRRSVRSLLPPVGGLHLKARLADPLGQPLVQSRVIHSFRVEGRIVIAAIGRKNSHVALGDCERRVVAIERFHEGRDAARKLGAGVDGSIG